MSAVTIPLGAKVRFARRIRRVESDHSGKGHSWVIVPDSPGDGIFMGYRYKQNGAWEDCGEDGEMSYEFCASSRVKVALVVIDAWRNPLTVDPDGLEVIE